MRLDLQTLLFVAFAVFCRVGSAMTLIPGIGSARVPTNVRILLAFGITLALLPMLFDRVLSFLQPNAVRLWPYLLFNEVVVGLAMGLMSRAFLFALQFSATTASSAIGLAGVPGQPVDDAEALPPLTNLISLGGIMMLVSTGLPYEMIRAVALSYDTIPMAIGFDTRWALDTFLEVLTDTTLLGLRLSAPFIAYGVVVNFAMGLANKFTPQFSMYFTSLGLVTLGGLVLLAFTSRQILSAFAEGLASWIAAN